MSDRGVAYAQQVVGGRFVTCFPGTANVTAPPNRAPTPFTGARPGMVYTLRKGRVGYHPDLGMQQDYYPNVFHHGETSFASLLDFCTDHLNTMYPHLAAVINFVYKRVKPMSSVHAKCNVDVLLPGHDSWIPLAKLPVLFQYKVVSPVLTEYIVLFPSATIGDFVGQVEKQLGVDLDSYDLKMRDGNLDLSDAKNPLSISNFPRLAALTLQHKDMQGKLKMRRGEMPHHPDPVKFMTLGDLKSRRRRHDEEDEEDDDDEDLPAVPPAPTKKPQQKRKPKTLKPKIMYRDDLEDVQFEEEEEVIHRRQRTPILDVAVDDNRAIPFFNDVGDGRVSVGFNISSEMTHLLPEILTPSGFHHIDPFFKEHVSASRKRVRLEKKQQQQQQQQQQQ
jgi:hypothetical protein